MNGTFYRVVRDPPVPGTTERVVDVVETELGAREVRDADAKRLHLSPEDAYRIEVVDEDDLEERYR